MATRATTRPPLDLRGNMPNGKRKSVAGHKPIDEEEPDKKKRKPAAKKQPAFKPQPVPITNSSDTPPTDNEIELPPPPVSERKIARRRESTRNIRERQESPTPANPNAISSSSNNDHAKRAKVGGNVRSRSKSIDPIRSAINTSDDPLGGVEETASMKLPTSSSTTTTTALQVQGLSIPSTHPQRPSAPRPLSPPRRTFSSSHLKSSIMGPPPTTGGFTRKTRQSMGKGRIGELSTESVVPIMQSETPVIRKNQELRGQQAKRSSLDHRGSRASSSWGRGEITMPHKNVDSKWFYRHIPVSYPEPIKARMLLVWCAIRALDESLKTPSSSSRKDKGKGKAKPEEGRTDEGDKMLKEIMDEFVREMNRGGVDTSVFGLPGQDKTVMGLKPHPRNASNRKVEAAANADIRKFKDEGSQWSTLISFTNAKQQNVMHSLERKKIQDQQPDVTKAEAWMKDALSVAEGIILQGEGELEGKGEFEDVEYKVDTLQQTSHVALQYILQSSRFLDGIFSSLTSDLRTRDRLGLPSILPERDDEGPDTVSLLSTTRRSAPSGSSSIIDPTKAKSDPMMLLRALAKKESSSQDEKVLEKAMQIPPVALSSATPRRPTATSSSGTATTMTPRRHVLGQTPRKKGMTPGPSEYLTTRI
ncbi:uncharacterized protein IL334_005584 [Kwoniella shivajii]|uniref:Kinetochore protein Mis13/DSN1 n=1 Tax=Kwoniella shivajii TaxID=564305 RepID=A0ABZ1D3J1_9TREE|nr:hypothetical protein IL334_005584 [Kwoniella shivajii]